eukprot:15462321-Alexandrium_andersonii.AAC.1
MPVLPTPALEAASYHPGHRPYAVRAVRALQTEGCQFRWFARGAARRTGRDAPTTARTRIKVGKRANAEPKLLRQ